MKTTMLSSGCLMLSTACTVMAGPVAPGVPSQSAAGVIDACSLLAKAEVEAAVGHPVLAPRREQVLNTSTCFYGDPQAPPEKLEPSPIVSVSVFVGGMEEHFPGFPMEAKDAFEMEKKNTATPQPIGAFGDDAYWEESRRALMLRRGNYMIEIKLQPDAGGQSAAKILATKVLERLP